jgi:hypothetical protein
VTSTAIWQARDVILSRNGDVEPFEGQTIQGADSIAGAFQYSLLTNYGWTMRLAYLHWENGEREMRALDCNSTEHRMHDMCNRLRMSISAVDGNAGLAWMELSQARLIDAGDPIRTTKKLASEAEFMEGAGGIAPRSAFVRLGARFGTRQEVMADGSRRRGYLCVAFPHDDAVVPAVAFILARVLPVWNQYGLEA